jgi:hypothetical protein
MFEIGNYAADDVVGFCVDKATSLRKAATSHGMRGRENSRKRAQLRADADDYERVVAGLNTGEGVTRMSVDR